MKKNEFEEMLLNYLTSNDEQKKELDKQIDNIWLNMSNQYSNVCSNDPKYVEIFSQIEKLHNILDFNIYHEYSENIYNEEIDDYDFTFQEEVYKEHEFIAQNYEKIITKVQSRIEKLKKAPLVINRDEKIKKLEAKIAYCNNAKEKWDYCQNQEELCKEYNKNRKTLVDPIEKEYKGILIKHAQDIIKKTIKDNPLILCKEHNTIWGSLNGAQGRVLNNVFNDLQRTVISKVNVKTNKTNRM